MKNTIKMFAQSLAVAIPLMVFGTSAFAETHDSRLTHQIRHELVMLPYQGVFDNLTFRIDGGSVELTGAVARPMLKSDAENVVKRLEGVTSVTNKIEVLPLSQMDDQIRLASYYAIYHDSALATRYAYNSQPSIRILVKNGNVTLEGFVANDFDRTVVDLRAKSVPNVFSVTNNLKTDTL
jgi:hyperosmotically inducible protein